MALVAKIKNVGYEQTIDNGDGTTDTVDLSLRGRFFCVVDYYDSANPSVIFKTETFEFPVDSQVADVQASIVAFGQRVRDARVRVGELQQYVGAVIPLT